MPEQNRLKSAAIIAITGFLSLGAVGLIAGFLVWFGSGFISFANKSTAGITQAWQGISGLVETLLTSSWSSIVILGGFSILALIVWWLARTFAQYEEFNPAATIVYQVVTPIVIIPSLLLSSPFLFSYVAIQAFSGNGDALINQVQQVAGLIAPPEVKLLPGGKDYSDN
jgi:hypothetical protein